MCKNFVSIIITHWSDNEQRSAFLRTSLRSLFESTEFPYELIVVDNGEKIEDSRYLLDLTHEGKINTYIRNDANRHFSYARNQALSIAQGNYFCIADNDIFYNKNWLDKCVNVLESHREQKWYATPIDYPHDAYEDAVRYRTHTFEFDKETYSLNMRAGSNCMVISRDKMRFLGRFPIHRIGGTKWTDKASRNGFLAVVLPQGYATDIGLRSGYNLNTKLPVFIKLSNGEKVYFNQDEYANDSGIYSIPQREFNT